MARYHATVESRCSATETFRCLASFSNAAEWDPGMGPRSARRGSSWIPARSALAADSGSSCRSWGCSCL